MPGPTSSRCWYRPRGPRSGSGDGCRPGTAGLVRRCFGVADKNPAAKKKAITAIAHTLLKMAYQVLKTGTPYQDLGADFYTRQGITRAEAGLAGTPAAKASPRLHHHHQPPGGRLTTQRLTTSLSASQEPPPNPAPRPARRTNQRHPPALSHHTGHGSLPRAHQDPVSVSGRPYPQSARIVRECCTVADCRCLPLGAAVALTVAVGAVPVCSCGG